MVLVGYRAIGGVFLIYTLEERVALATDGKKVEEGTSGFEGAGAPPNWVDFDTTNPRRYVFHRSDPYIPQNPDPHSNFVHQEGPVESRVCRRPCEARHIEAVGCAISIVVDYPELLLELWLCMRKRWGSGQRRNRSSCHIDLCHRIRYRRFSQGARA